MNRNEMRLGTVALCTAMAALLFSSMFAAERVRGEAPQATAWGVSSSASGSRNHAEWFPKMAEAGVTTVRLFPEWNGIEREEDLWNWDQADTILRNAEESNLEINGILMGSPPGSQAVHTFPMENLEDWSRYVSTTVGRYKGRIEWWEVWNEGNGGFNDGRHTTADYAKLAATTYAAAKQANPESKIGLTVASYDPAYLQQAILAMKQQGRPDSFDYLCIHPYELADGLARTDGEIPFLWMSRLMRDMLRETAPERADAEIWITEVGSLLENRAQRTNTEGEAAEALVKIYTLAIAQGIARTQWFEAQDPIGEQSGFGLLDRSGSPRASYTALKTLAKQLGPNSNYVGWVALGPEGRGYGFVFEGPNEPLLIAWIPRGIARASLSFPTTVQRVDAARGESTRLAANQPFELGVSPVCLIGVPADLVKQARANRDAEFPWGGEFRKAKTVSLQLGSGDTTGGIFPAGGHDRPVVTFDDGSAGVLVAGDIGNPLSFFVHPSFAGINTREYFIRVTARRVAPGNVGMNLLYETADSQGRTPYVNSGKWFGVTANEGWQTCTWHIKNACFAKMWGYDFVIRPEQSIPFAIGKVEVSTEPFE